VHFTLTSTAQNVVPVHSAHKTTRHDRRLSPPAGSVNKAMLQIYSCPPDDDVVAAVVVELCSHSPAGLPALSASHGMGRSLIITEVYFY
jgi:coenzyme F420-reducing hydrogenase gamma subunit